MLPARNGLISRAPAFSFYAHVITRGFHQLGVDCNLGKTAPKIGRLPKLQMS